jgi:hypothetical protein
MDLVLNRAPSHAGATLGKLYADDKFLCHTLEDEIREQAGVPVMEWKLRGKTAIPAGRYRVTLENSPRFGPETLTIHDVPGFQFIRMHAGNTAADTEGCPLLGMTATDRSLVAGTSRPAVALVKTVVRQAIAQGEDVRIDVNNPSEVA